MKGYLRPFQRIVRLYRDSNLRRPGILTPTFDTRSESSTHRGGHRQNAKQMVDISPLGQNYLWSTGLGDPKDVLG